MTRKIWNLARKPIKRPMQVLDNRCRNPYNNISIIIVILLNQSMMMVMNCRRRNCQVSTLTLVLLQSHLRTPIGSSVSLALGSASIRNWVTATHIRPSLTAPERVG